VLPVLSTPKGVEASLGSLGELAVRLAPEAPAFIEGVIKVATTAENRPPLTVSVLHVDSSQSSGTERPAERGTLPSSASKPTLPSGMMGDFR
jgi:hypothetical protein